MNPTLQQIEAEAAEQGLTMTDVCRRAGVNFSTWWRWKRSRTEPRTSKLDAIRKALHPRKP